MRNNKEKYKKYKSKYLLLAGQDTVNPQFNDLSQELQLHYWIKKMLGKGNNCFRDLNRFKYKVSSCSLGLIDNKTIYSLYPSRNQYLSCKPNMNCQIEISPNQYRNIEDFINFLPISSDIDYLETLRNNENIFIFNDLKTIFLSGKCLKKSESDKSLISIPLGNMYRMIFSSLCQYYGFTNCEPVNSLLKNAETPSLLSQGANNKVFALGGRKYVLRLNITNMSNRDELLGLRLQAELSLDSINSRACNYVNKVYDFGYYQYADNYTANFFNQLGVGVLKGETGVYAILEMLLTELNIDTIQTIGILKLLITQILTALSCIHQKGYCHLDIKAQNIMVKTWDVFKLIDFGETYLFSSRNIKTAKGSPEYMAPEMWETPINPDNIDGKCDIWSLGILIMRICLKTSPDPEPNNGGYRYPTQKIEELKTKDYLRGTNQNNQDNLYQLVSNMLQVHPERRWSADQCLASDFLNS